jgi:hypothetical protein
MTRRFEGAITTPDDEPTDSSILPAPTRPPRPVSIEIAAAILIVGAISAILGTLASARSAGTAASQAGAGPIVALLLALNVLTVIVGFLVRSGRAWLACISIVAVLVFIELTAIPGGSAVAALLAVLDGFVFVALARHRAWFDWQPSPEAADVSGNATR